MNTNGNVTGARQAFPQGCIEIQSERSAERGGDSLSPQSQVHNVRNKLSPSRKPVVAVALLLCALRGLAGTQPVNPDLVSARSYSGQFIAYARRSVAPPSGVLALATNQHFVQLEPNLATVSCERIKQELFRELGATPSWRGNIYVVLYPARGVDDTITVTAERAKDRWQYQVDFPNVVERSRYVRVMVQVVLLEMANRTAQAHATELPLWLVEGFAQLLMASNEMEIILPPPRATLNGLSFSSTLVNSRKETLLQQAQNKLRGRPPLTFENLSWPPNEELSGESGDLYRGSAQLFVGELLRLPEGRACLRTMLAQLPRYYNWQFAFLQAFHASFERPLDVEKWWALALVRAGVRDLTQTWTPEESWQKLDEAIHSAVQVRTGANELPLHAEANLQTVIREWDSVRQTQAINNTLRELGLLRLRIAQEFVGLAQDYSQTLETYLQQRDRGGSILPFTRKTSRRRAIEAAVQRLDALDTRRAALRPAPKPVTATPAPAP